VTLTVKIDGSAVEMSEGTLAVERRVGERAVCSLELPMADSPATFYSKGHPIEVLEGGRALFAGFLEQPVLQPVGPAKYAYRIDAVDNCYLADKRVAAESYQNQTAGYIVKDLKDTYLEPEGVAVSDVEIEDGPTIKGAIFNYIRVSEALDALAERANFWWRIDQDKVLHFKARTTQTAPFTLDDTRARRGSIKVEHGNPLYRNRQYVRGGQDITDAQVETRKGDGEARAWAMGFPLAKVPTVKVNTVTKTVGIKGVESGKNFYWGKGDPVIAQELLDTVLSSSDTLEVTYQGQFALVALTFDEAEIEGRKTREGGGTGYVDDVSQNPEADNRDIAFEIGNAKLVKFANIGKRITFRVQSPRVVNLMDNPSVETDLLGWNAWGGATVVRDSSTKKHGNWSAKVTTNPAVGYSGVQLLQRDGTRFAVTAGEKVTFSFSFYTLSSGKNMRAVLRFYDADTGGSQVGPDVNLDFMGVGAFWLYWALTAEVPVGATHAYMLVRVNGAGQGTFDFWVDGAMLQEADEAGDYADGDQPGGTWYGTAHESQSRVDLEPGQLLLVDLPNFDLTNVAMLVESVIVTTTGDIVWYEVVAAQGPELGSWTRFFDALSLAAPRVDLINIGLDEVLTIYVPFSEAWSWGESSGVTVLSCPVPSTTLYPLASMYPC